ncbi:MAG: hypothetical protein IKJ27_04130 [Clostridia bacterium]|nr:hypothetical protein [Clostridia bacterium]
MSRVEERKKERRLPFLFGIMNLSEFVRVCGLSRTTFYKYVGLLEG